MRQLLPRALAVPYARFGRYGIVLLFAMMAVWPRGLELRLTPTQWAAGSSLVALVNNGLVLPAAAPWLR